MVATLESGQELGNRATEDLLSVTRTVRWCSCEPMKWPTACAQAKVPGESPDDCRCLCGHSCLEPPTPVVGGEPRPARGAGGVQSL